MGARGRPSRSIAGFSPSNGRGFGSRSGFELTRRKADFRRAARRRALAQRWRSSPAHWRLGLRDYGHIIGMDTARSHWSPPRQDTGAPGGMAAPPKRV